MHALSTISSRAKHCPQGHWNEKKFFYSFPWQRRDRTPKQF